MLELTLTAKSRAALLRPTKHLRISGELSQSELDADLPVGGLAARLFELAPNILPKVVLQYRATDSVVSDVRGRPSETFSTEVVAASERSEELFASGGNVFRLPGELDSFPDSPSALEQIPFSYSIESSFKQYLPDGHVEHNVSAKASEPLQTLLPALSPNHIVRALPLHLSYVRIGLELYQKRFFGSMLGLVPYINARLYLEIERQRIRFFVEEEEASLLARLPLQDMGIIRALSQILEERHLFSNLRDQIKASLERSS